MQIAAAKNWLNTSLEIIDLSQMITQALWMDDSPLLQVPGATHKLVAELKDRKPPLRNLRQLYSLPKPEREEIMCKLPQEKESKDVISRIPQLQIVESVFKVAGDDIITPGSIVTFLLRLRCLPADKTNIVAPAANNPEKTVQEIDKGTIVIDEDSEDVDGLMGPKKDLDDNIDLTDSRNYAHAPYLQAVSERG